MSYNAKLICVVCMVYLLAVRMPRAHAFYGQACQAGLKGIVALCSSVKRIMPSTPATIVSFGLACSVVARALWTRYVFLRKINYTINPDACLYVDQMRHPIYNWMTGVPVFVSPAQIRAHDVEVKDALVVACLAGHVDIFQAATGMPLTAGRIYWADVMSSIEGEMRDIRRIMRSLESFVGVSFRGIHLFGIRKKFESICNELEIGGLVRMRHVLTADQEARIEAVMGRVPGLDERVIALCMANPNYDKAHLIFWELDQRLGRLFALKEAIMRTPIAWNVALH